MVSGRILLVGASGGVGQQLAVQLIERGYEVLGTVINQRDLEMTRQTVPGLKDLIIADFSDADTAKKEVERALGQSESPLVGVIGAAGVSPCGPLETAPLSDLRLAIEVNAIANLAVYQASMPYLRRSKGKVIFISSFAGKIATPMMGYYVASKFTLEGLADGMRLEAGQWGVSITLMEPGAIATSMKDTYLRTLHAVEAGMSAEDRANYGAYLEQTKAFALDSDTPYLAPEIVAAKVVEVLETDDPEARYEMGNAIDLLAKRRELSDREFDAMWNSWLPGNRLSA